LYAIGACADVPEMPGNVTVVEVSASTVLLRADSPPVKPVSEHGGLAVVSWVVTYQAESDDAAPIGRESRATFPNGTNMPISPLLIKSSILAHTANFVSVYLGQQNVL